MGLCELDYMVAIYSTMHVTTLKVGLPTARCCFNLGILVWAQDYNFYYMQHKEEVRGQRERGKTEEMGRGGQKEMRQSCMLATSI